MCSTAAEADAAADIVEADAAADIVEGPTGPLLIIRFAGGSKRGAAFFWASRRPIL